MGRGITIIDVIKSGTAVYITANGIDSSEFTFGNIVNHVEDGCSCGEVKSYPNRSTGGNLFCWCICRIEFWFYSLKLLVVLYFCCIMDSIKFCYRELGDS